MNWLDVVLLCLAGFGFVKGLFDGIINGRLDEQTDRSDTLGCIEPFVGRLVRLYVYDVFPESYT